MQTASAVLCYSRMLFFQCYPTFRRFDCKVFLTDALRYLGGVTARVMIDNTHMVVLRGSGREMVPVPRWPPWESVSVFSSWRTQLGMRTVRRASSVPSISSRITSWPGAPSAVGRL